MFRITLPTLATVVVLTLVVSSCVPQRQYDGLVIERDYYRNQVTKTDSLNDERAISTYNQVENTSGDLDRRIRQVEQLTATNITLNNSYQDLKARYDELLDQNQKMLMTTGDATTQFENSLAERTATVAAREAELRQMELDLEARERALARVEGGNVNPGPASYGTVVAPTDTRPALSGAANASLKLNEVQNDLSQLLAYLPRDQYTINSSGANRLMVTLKEPVLSTDGYSVSAGGQDLIRRLGTTLRNYPEAEIIVVGHASDVNPVNAYENSTDKAINVVQQLITFGVDPAKVTAAGKGAYDPVADNSTPEGQRANRRMNLIVTIPAYNRK